MAVDPRLLEAFVVLAEEMHVARAAARLCITQPALSKQLSRLERQVGALLFDRTSRPMSLTAAGQAMLEPATRSVRAAEEAEAAARTTARDTPSVLRVGVDIDLDDALGGVEAFATPRPAYEVWLSRYHEAQGHDAVIKGHIDVFIGYRPLDSAAATERVQNVEVPLLAVVHPDHPLAAGEQASLTEYRKSPIAIFARDNAAPESFDYVLSLLSSDDAEAPSHALEVLEVRATSTTSYVVMLAEVAAGRAVSFSTKAHVQGNSQVRAMPFDPPLSVPIYVSWHAPPTASTKALVTSLGLAEHRA